VAEAPDAATAQEWCDLAEAGAFRGGELRGERQVRFVLPRREDRQFVCPLPAGRSLARRREREQLRLQEFEEESHAEHERRGHLPPVHGPDFP
jgi:hypothetical protein